jgi:hypothetical protein
VSRGAAVLPAALAAIAVSAALAAALVEVARVEVLVARHRQATTAALLAADACLAGVVADVPPTWDFDTLLVGPDGARGTADDGALAPRPACTGSADVPPGPAAPPRARVRLSAAARRGRRTVEAILGLDPTPGVGTLLWLGRSPVAASIGGTIALDGADAADPAADAASVGAPEWPDTLDAWLASEAGRVVASPRTRPPLMATAPPLEALGARIRAAGPAGAEALVAGPPAPRLAYVAGGLTVGGALRGAGLLFVDGALDIAGTLDFTGLVVVTGDVRIRAGGSLTIGGALWSGASGAFAVDGDLGVRRDGAALATADGLVRLPRRAVLLGQRDLG